MALGSSEPEVLVAETDSDAVESSCSENDLLSMVWSWLDGSREVGSADFASLWQILRVRSLAVDCSDRRTNSVFPIYSQASISRLAEELAAFGLGEGFRFRQRQWCFPRGETTANPRWKQWPFSSWKQNALWCWRVGQCFERLR